MSDPLLQLHSDSRSFLEMVRVTSDQSGFNARMVEKDYYSSLVLQALCVDESPLVFKGGTCISKVFSSFYRLSEDLDFCIPVPASRTIRRHTIVPLKEMVATLPDRIAGIVVQEPLIGRNESTQYIAQLGYESVITSALEPVKVEVGLREPLMRPSENRSAKTLLKDSFSGRDILVPFAVRVMNEQEAWAEKMRAALCRLEPAIRDFFDLHFASTNLGIDLESPYFLDLVSRKLAVPGNGPIVLSAERRADLDRQIKGQLQPVLRSRDFERFDLARIWDKLVTLAKHLKEA
jgi:predicted nucleotidyltransferase component of viral defense system